MSRVRWGLWLAMLAIICLGGCGSGVKARLYKVTGTVKFADGQPVTSGTIYFDSNQFNAYGQIQPDGSFTLTTLRPNDGAPAGTYRVYLSGDLMGAGGNPALVHTKYATGFTSGITEEVKPQANHFDITVDRYVAPPPKEPAK
jgi:hypothetical protein